MRDESDGLQMTWGGEGENKEGNKEGKRERKREEEEGWEPSLLTFNLRAARLV